MELRSWLAPVGWNLELPLYSKGTMVQLNHKFSRKNKDSRRIHNSTLKDCNLYVYAHNFLTDGIGMAIDTPQLLQTYLADGLSGKTLPSTREPL
jgi:hypothetical protein